MKTVLAVVAVLVLFAAGSLMTARRLAQPLQAAEATA